MMNRLGSSDVPFAPAYMASSQKEQLWDSDSTAGLQNHLFYHQVPTLEDMSTSLRSFPSAEYLYSPLGFVQKREDNVSVAAGQIGLDLGRRTYFSSYSSGDDARRLFSRPKGGGVLSPSLQPSRCQCQAEGCKSDLSGANHYHRRHKVCDFHSKATIVIAHGLQQRFCQQCSRFHVLAEFDEAKRSCRKRLADHNRRRRKPHLISAAAAAASTKHDADCSTSMITPRTSGMAEQGDRRKDEVAVGALLFGEQEKLSHRRRRQQQQQYCFSSLADQCKSRFLDHQNTWSSAPNEVSMSMEEGPSSHLHLDRSMFELDFI